MNDKGMNDIKNENMGKRTPLSVVMDTAKNEIGNFSLGLMQKNNIPPFLMCYIMKSVLSDIQQVALEKLSNEFIETQRALAESQNCKTTKEVKKANGN